MQKKPYTLEQAAFESWPALETETHAGWLLRFGKGYTKRANSVNAGEMAQPLSAEDLRKIEEAYRTRDLPPMFRIVPDSALVTTDSLLIERGYRFTDLSLVMTGPLTAAAPSEDLCFLDNPATWLDLFQQISGKPIEGQALHLDILLRIRHPSAYAVKYQGGTPVSCGLAVLANGYLGLFDIATTASLRGKGHACQLCRGLLEWGREAGAQSGYMQVVGANTAAIRLYESLGYRYAYHYWYRVAPH